MEENEIKRLIKLAVRNELAIQDVTDAILSLHIKAIDVIASLPVSCIDGFTDDKFCDNIGACEWCKNKKL